MRGVVTALALALILAGCGFQLRGQAELPAAMARTHIDAQRSSDELPRQLILLLRSSGVDVSHDRVEASAVLVVLEDRFDREVQSIGASARVREFALRYTVRFRVDDADGGVIVPEQELELFDTYEFDQEQVLGTTSEEELLRREMTRNMARLVVRRLETAARP